MIELRKDYILDRWSYIALGRSKRPQETEINVLAAKDDNCYFCPGNEHMTPPEIGRKSKDEKWNVRWFANKFPAVESGLATGTNKKSEIFEFGEGFGFHEVIAETSDHSKQLADLPKESICEILKVYAERIKELSIKEGVKYVQIFKNSGAAAGTSIAHSHSQIIASQIIPRYLKEKIEATKKFSQCPYCEIIAQEREGERFIFENESSIAFASFAPRFNYEVLVFPKKHYKNITEISESEFMDLAETLQKILYKLGKIGAPYNFFLHYAPEGEEFHFHFEITPRLNTWAGFELATESFVITTSPEEAATFYKE